METGKLKIIYKKTAVDSMIKIAVYIESRGYPETAKRFLKELFIFGDTLGAFPEKYPFSSKTAWGKRNIRCATFSKNYIFLYKVLDDELIILNVVHTKTMA